MNTRFIYLAQTSERRGEKERKQPDIQGDELAISEPSI